jgi:hypothetical protein
MVEALRGGGPVVEASDIACGEDFLTSAPPVELDAIVTNPPYMLAREFIGLVDGPGRRKAAARNHLPARW